MKASAKEVFVGHVKWLPYVVLLFCFLIQECDGRWPVCNKNTVPVL